MDEIVQAKVIKIEKHKRPLFYDLYDYLAVVAIPLVVVAFIRLAYIYGLLK